jgi:predicted nucleotidyltransferase
MIHMYRNMLNKLAPFFDHPTRRFHIREYARLAKVSPMTARRYLNEFQKEGLIVPKPEKIRVKSFQANLESPIFREYKKFHTLLKVRRSGLVDYLNDHFLYPPIYVFGSTAKGEDYEGSDLDIFVLSNQRAEARLELFERMLKRKIELFAMTDGEFEKAKRDNPELLNNILSGIRVSGLLKVFK